MKSARWLSVAFSLVLIGVLCMPALAAPQIVDAYYRHDVPFPEFTEYWKDTGKREAELNLKLWKDLLAGSAHVYVKNTGKAPLEITDIMLAGLSLKKAIAFSPTRQNVRKEVEPASIFFSNLSTADRTKLIRSGDPIWWRVQPQVIAPGEMGEIAVRFRKNPPGSSLKLVLPVKGGKPVSVSVPLGKRPRIESVCFSSDLTSMSLICTTAGAPKTVSINGQDVSAQCKIAYDPKVSLAPITVSLKTPLKRGSYCCIGVGYAGGAQTMESIRVWSDEPAYGMWGGQTGEEGDFARARAYYDDLARHNINCQMEQIGQPCVISFLSSQEGRDYIAKLGIRRTINSFGKQGMTNPYFYFLVDEPESADFFVKGVPTRQLSGCCTQGLVNYAQELFRDDPITPSALNMNRTFPPECFYIYGRVPDILMTDPYYTGMINSIMDRNPARLPLYLKPKCIYAFSREPVAAAAPRPVNLVLLACNGRVHRYPTPEEKRAEVYYSLAGGAKQLSFWWFTPSTDPERPGGGCGADLPEAKALWREIGLLGAEFRTVDSLIADSYPSTLAVTAPSDLWVRTLISGHDSLVIICVNENYASDRLGTERRTIPDSRLKVQIPKWLSPKDTFEVTCKGTNNVDWTRTADSVGLHIGKTDLTRLIIVTADPKLRARLQSRYDKSFAGNVTKLQ
jgi:hypothetical protein